MYKFIRYFINAWVNYPSFIAFCNRFSDEQKKAMEAEDAKRGIKPYRSRFDYAYKNAKIHYSHRDRYGRKCKKYKGDCEMCNAKHC